MQENAAYFQKKIVIDENDALSEYNKIPLGHNRTNGAVYSKIYFKVEEVDYFRVSCLFFFLCT